MIQNIIILSIVLAVIGIIVKWPRPGVYLYKAACLALLLPGLVFALFFSLRGLDVTSLNIALHPWREYVLWRFLFATGVIVVLFAVSQIPFLFIRKFTRNEKLRIIKVEGTIYLCLLAIGTGLLYYVVQEDDYAENRIITQIEDFRKAHAQYPDSINPAAFQSGYIIAPDSLSVRYWHNNDEFMFLAENVYGKYVYDSRTGLWGYIPNDESEKNDSDYWLTIRFGPDENYSYYSQRKYWIWDYDQNLTAEKQEELFKEVFQSYKPVWKYDSIHANTDSINTIYPSVPDSLAYCRQYYEDGRLAAEGWMLHDWNKEADYADNIGMWKYYTRDGILIEIQWPLK